MTAHSIPQQLSTLLNIDNSCCLCSLVTQSFSCVIQSVARGQMGVKTLDREASYCFTVSCRLVYPPIVPQSADYDDDIYIALASDHIFFTQYNNGNSIELYLERIKQRRLLLFCFLYIVHSLYIIPHSQSRGLLLFDSIEGQIKHWDHG